MDNAPLRRGKATVHEKYGNHTALLAGDVMLVAAYEQLNKMSGQYIVPIMNIFNRTAKEVCEGQQLDMDFEADPSVDFDRYLNMINLKTSVLLAASLKMGAILGGAGEGNQDLLYQFGRKIGLAFQLQDDYLDAFGDPSTFGKKPGGDIMANKKTFLLIHALETATPDCRAELTEWLNGNKPEKVENVIRLFKQCKVDEWAQELREKYLTEAHAHLEDIAVVSVRKKPLKDLAAYLVQRTY
jgi:geranylgeranyl diphosphate synthase, type II